MPRAHLGGDAAPRMRGRRAWEWWGPTEAKEPPHAHSPGRRKLPRFLASLDGVMASASGRAAGVAARPAAAAPSPAPLLGVRGSGSPFSAASLTSCSLRASCAGQGIWGNKPLSRCAGRALTHALALATGRRCSSLPGLGRQACARAAVQRSSPAARRRTAHAPALAHRQPRHARCWMGRRAGTRRRHAGMRGAGWGGRQACAGWRLPAGSSRGCAAAGAWPPGTRPPSPPAAPATAGRRKGAGGWGWGVGALGARRWWVVGGGGGRVVGQCGARSGQY